jgi:hypothetical protein
MITFQPSTGKSIEDLGTLTTRLNLDGEQMAGIWYAFHIYSACKDTFLADVLHVSNFTHQEIPFPHSVQDELPDLIFPYSENMRDDPNTVLVHLSYNPPVPNPLTRSEIQITLFSEFGYVSNIDMKYTAYVGNNKFGFIVMFDTPEFIQGYLTACNWLNVVPEYHSITDGKQFYTLG